MPVGIVLCVTSVLNWGDVTPQYGLNVVMDTPAAIEALALLLDTKNDQLRIEVMTLLIVVTWMSAEGARYPTPLRFDFGIARKSHNP